MLERFPKFYEEFTCLAGACPHTCCAAWEVVLDEDTAAYYRKVPGDLGERLRAAMMVDGDGDTCFPLDGGRCPFLDGENLCEIHRTLGEQATSVTCREHPRFIEDYGPFREITLSASCPEAGQLLFARPFILGEREISEEGEPGDDWLRGLLPLRKTMMEVLSDETRPVYHRLRDFLLLALAAQDLLDQEEIDALPGLTTEQAEWAELPHGPAMFPETFTFLQQLERLDDDWGALLEQAKSAAVQPGHDQEIQRVAEYGTFRYLLKCVNDGDLLSRAQLCVFLALAAEKIGAVCGIPEALRRLSCELEHSDDNLDALLEAFCTRPEFSWEAMLCALT